MADLEPLDHDPLLSDILAHYRGEAEKLLADATAKLVAAGIEVDPLPEDLEEAA